VFFSGSDQPINQGKRRSLTANFSPFQADKFASICILQFFRKQTEGSG